MQQLTTDPIRRGRLLQQGFSSAELETAVRRGVFHRLWPGVYSTENPVDPVSHAQLRIRAAAIRSPDLVVSHQSAAVLWGAPTHGVDLLTVHFTRVGGNGGRGRPGRMVHAARLTEADVAAHEEIMVTSAARTLFDLARSVAPSSAVVVGDWFVAQGLVTTGQMAEILDRSQTVPGRPRALRAIRAVDGRSESVGESLTRWAVVSGGLSPPDLQIEARGPDGRFLGRSDFGYAEVGLLGEFDGLVKYRAGNPSGQRPEDVVIAEKVREDALRAVGATILRITWNDLSSPHQVVQRISSAYDQASRRAAAAGLTGCFSPAPPRRLEV